MPPPRQLTADFKVEYFVQCTQGQLQAPDGASITPDALYLRNRIPDETISFGRMHVVDHDVTLVGHLGYNRPSVTIREVIDDHKAPVSVTIDEDSVAV